MTDALPTKMTITPGDPLQDEILRMVIEQADNDLGRAIAPLMGALGRLLEAYAGELGAIQMIRKILDEAEKLAVDARPGSC